MRKAGEILEHSGTAGKQAQEAIQRVADDFSEEAYELARHSEVPEQVLLSAQASR